MRSAGPVARHSLHGPNCRPPPAGPCKTTECQIAWHLGFVCSSDSVDFHRRPAIAYIYPEKDKGNVGLFKMWRSIGGFQFVSLQLETNWVVQRAHGEAGASVRLRHLPSNRCSFHPATWPVRLVSRYHLRVFSLVQWCIRRLQWSRLHCLSLNRIGHIVHWIGTNRRKKETGVDEKKKETGDENVSCKSKFVEVRTIISRTHTKKNPKAQFENSQCKASSYETGWANCALIDVIGAWHRKCGLESAKYLDILVGRKSDINCIDCATHRIDFIFA